MVTSSRVPNSLTDIATSIFDKPGAIPTSQRIELLTSVSASGVISLKDRSAIFKLESLRIDVI